MVANSNVDKDDARPNFSLIVSEADSTRIRQQLDRMLVESGANSTLLLDKSGEVIAARGERLPQTRPASGQVAGGCGCCQPRLRSG